MGQPYQVIREHRKDLLVVSVESLSAGALLFMIVEPCNASPNGSIRHEKAHEQVTGGHSQSDIMSGNWGNRS